jgi:signal recognition particle receptor subunit alpha
VTVNNPDKIIFVGEALVGNEAVDQLTKFDRSLKDFSAVGGARRRGIDGIILTKFDTIVSPASPRVPVLRLSLS